MKAIKTTIKKAITSDKGNLLQMTLSLIYSGMGSIVMLHRVLPLEEQGATDICRGIEITPRYLEEMINHFIENKYEFLSLDQLYDVMANKRKLRSRFVVFTFDDGYIDNYTYAYPIFKSYLKPFNIYVSTSFPDKTAKLWWYGLSDLVEKSDLVKFIHEGRDYSYACKSLQEKNDVIASLKKLIMEDSRTRGSIQDSIFEQNGIDLGAYNDRLAMTWEHIEELSRDRLVTIGAHTVSHRVLSELSYADARAEIKDSRDRIELKTGASVDHLAYPFGWHGQADRREFEIAQSLGFKTATTTRLGNIFRYHKKHLCNLPRIYPSFKGELAFPKFYASGIAPMIDNRFKLTSK